MPVIESPIIETSASSTDETPPMPTPAMPIADDESDDESDDDIPTIPTSVITSLEDKKAVVTFLDKLSPILAAKDDIVRLLPRERKDQ